MNRMMVGMISNKTKTQYRKNSLLILGTLLVAACQPPASTADMPAVDKQAKPDSPIVINADSVTMGSEHILSIKPSRYQPSLGLQGDIEAIKQARFKSAQALTVHQVLVTEGQWVDAGTPLFVVQRQDDNDEVKVETNNINNNIIDDNAENKIKTANTQVSVDNKTDDIITDSPNKTSINNTNTIANSAKINNASLNNTKANNTIDNAITTKQQAPSTSNTVPLITIKAPFTGRVDRLSIQAAQTVEANMPLLRISDDNDLQFVATLPIQAEPQLSVGQTVNFTRKGMSDKFTGQVSKLLAGTNPNELMIYVHIIDNEASRSKLKPDVAVNGRVDYGQIEVGTLVPKSAIHGVDLSVLKVAPYRPIMTLTANVWIIQQDQRLTRQPVEVIEYNPTTDRYLIAGVNNDSLICLAELPLKSAGKKVIIS